MGQDERGASHGALCDSYGVGRGGQDRAADAFGAHLRADGEVPGAEGRGADGKERADGKESGREGWPGPEQRVRSVVRVGGAVCRGGAAGLHEKSTHVLSADDAGRVVAIDVQAPRSSFATVWRVRRPWREELPQSPRR